MKQLFYTLLLTLACTAYSSQVVAQDYGSAIGLRFGYPISISFKTFLGDEGNALEAFAGYRGYGLSSIGSIQVGGLFEVHKEIGDVDGLNYYFGGGASVLFWTYDNVYWDDSSWSRITPGINGVIGLDYTFEDAPINLSLDWMPTLFIGSSYRTGFSGSYGALSARYILGGQ